MGTSPILNDTINMNPERCYRCIRHAQVRFDIVLYSYNIDISPNKSANYSLAFIKIL